MKQNNNNQKKALFVATVFRFLNFEKSDMELLKEMGYEIYTATNRKESEWLQDDGGLNYLHLHKRHIDFGRTPFSKKNIAAYRQLKRLMQQETFDVMHCHTPVAATIARLAAGKARKNGMKVIYTSHGFHFHRTSSIRNWLIFYPIEWFMAFFTDMIITINKEDYKVIQKFHVKEKHYIPGVGVDTSGIAEMEVDRAALRKKYHIPEQAFLILSIGELSDRKNHETVIRAIHQCQDSNIYYVICGTGEKKEYLQKLIYELGLIGRVILAGQLSHDEVLCLCHTCDIGALPSRIEGLGLAGIETLAAGKPLAASAVHGIRDYAIDGITGITNKADDITGFQHAIQRLQQDTDFYHKCQKCALPTARKFDLSKSRKLMRKNYCKLLQS